MVHITLNCLFLYIAILPIIAAARVQNGHLIVVVVAFVYGYGGMFAAGNMTLERFAYAARKHWSIENQLH